jgi:4-carboxymuconolactone decarboxylase
MPRLFVLLFLIEGAFAQQTKLPADVDPQSYSRLPLLKRDQLDPDTQRVFDATAGKDRAVAPIGPVGTSLYSPGVAEPMNQLNQYLRKTVVGTHYFEICALLAAREFDQYYEWSSHEPGAVRAGVDQKSIDAIKFNRDVKGLQEKDAAVIQFGRALFHQHKVSPALYSKIVEMFGKQGMFELTAVMGDYAMAAMMLDAVDQQLPPDRKPLLPVK